MEHVKPRNPNKRSRGTSVWYGKEKVSLDESSLILSMNLLLRLQRRAKICITSHARLAQPDVKT
jgi:hypothetical protein